MTPLAKSVDAARNNILAMTSRWADQTEDQAGLFVSLPGDARFSWKRHPLSDG